MRKKSMEGYTNNKMGCERGSKGEEGMGDIEYVWRELHTAPSSYSLYN